MVDQIDGGRDDVPQNEPLDMVHLCRAMKIWKSGTVRIEAASDAELPQRSRSSLELVELDLKRGRGPPGQVERELENCSNRREDNKHNRGDGQLRSVEPAWR